MVSLQRTVDYGLRTSNRAVFTINTAGDVVEGIITTAGTTEENVLEVACRNYKSVFIEGRNEDDTNVATFKIYATRKWSEAVEEDGSAYLDISGDHWELLDTQAAVTTNTNITPVEFLDKGYVHIVVTVQSSVAATETIVRAICC